LARIDEKTCAIYLLDIKMTGMDGIERLSTLDENISRCEQLMVHQGSLQHAMVIHSKPMQKIFSTIKEIGPSPVSALIF
jgi:DNA-binding NtrC family response regulator